MTLLFNGCQVTVEAAFNDSLFAASPTWTDITTYVRGREGITLRRSGRTSEIEAFQPGSAEIVCNLRNRALDPTYGPASVSFDGSGSDYWACGDVAGFSGATTLDVRFALSADDWTPAGTQTIIGQWGAAGQRSWRVILNTSGTLSLFTSNDGTATSSTGSGVQFCAVNAQAVAGRVTWTTSGTTTFYIKRSTKDRVVQDARSHDNWILVGSGAASTSALFNSTANVVVGALADGTNALDGTVYYASAATSMDDDTPLVAFWPKDAASASSTSWTGSVDGLSWTGTGTYVVDPQGLYYGRLLPGTPIRVSAVYSAVTYRLWYGYLRRAVLSYPGTGKDAVVRLQASDALAWLSDRQAPSTPFGIELENATQKPSAYWPLHEPVTSRTFSDAYGQSHGLWDAVTIESGAPSQPATQLPTHLLDDGAKAISSTNVDTTVDWVADLGYARFGFCLYLPSADTDTTQFRIMCGLGSQPMGFTYGVFSAFTAYTDVDEATITGRIAAGQHFVYVETDDISYIQVYVDGDLIGVLDGLTSPTTTIVNSLYVQGVGGVTISDVIFGGEWDEPTLRRAAIDGRALDTSGERMTWLLDAAGIPSGLYSITTDVSTYLGPSSAGGTYGELMRQVNTAEAGRLYVTGAGVITFRSRLWAITDTTATTSQGTFSDTYVDVTLQPADVSDVINEAIVTIANGSQGIFRDQESIDLYGVQPQSFSAPLSDPEAAASLGEHYVRLRSHPHQRVSSVSLKPRHAVNGTTLFPQVLGRDIGERITVTRNVTGTLKPSSTTTAVSAAVTIEGIVHRITEDDWTTTWTTVPAPLTASESGFFTLDDTLLGCLDAGNVLTP